MKCLFCFSVWRVGSFPKTKHFTLTSLTSKKGIKIFHCPMRSSAYRTQMHVGNSGVVFLMRLVESTGWVLKMKLLANSLTHSLIYSFVRSFCYLLIHQVFRSFVRSFICHPFVHRFVRWLVCLFASLFIRSVFPSLVPFLRWRKP